MWRKDDRLSRSSRSIVVIAVIVLVVGAGAAVAVAIVVIAAPSFVLCVCARVLLLYSIYLDSNAYVSPIYVSLHLCFLGSHFLHRSCAR